MIGKINTGSDFAGLVDYLLDPTKTPNIIDTNLLGNSRRQIIDELKSCADQRYTTKKPVKHIMIAFAPDDGEIEDELVNEIALTALQELGYTDNQYMIVRHDRLDLNHDRVHVHDHIHVLVNMINLEGERVSDRLDIFRLKDCLQKLEKKYNLTQTLAFDQRKYKGASTGQTQRLMREIEEFESGKSTDKPTAPYTLKIQAGIDLASHDKPSMSVFIARIQKLGIDLKFRVEEGVVQGISYRMQDFKTKGSKLHNASIKRLVEHRVDFDPSRDSKAVLMANKDETVPLDPEFNVEWNMTNLRDYVPQKLKQSLDRVFGEKDVQPLVVVEEQTSKDKEQGWEIE